MVKERLNAYSKAKELINEHSTTVQLRNKVES